MKNLGYWMGRPITELSREELYEIIEYLATELEETNERHKAMIEFAVEAVAHGPRL